MEKTKVSTEVKVEKTTEKTYPKTPPTAIMAKEPKGGNAPVLSGKTQVSGLSLKGLLASTQNEEEDEFNEETGPKEEFTETQLHAAWKNYIKQLTQKGQKILASILSTDYPSVDGTVLKIELANETMKTDVERDPGLMSHLRKAVKNYDLTLEIEVNEEAATRRAYTPQEKYEKLREKNPLLDTLKDTFDLEL